MSFLKCTNYYPNKNLNFAYVNWQGLSWQDMAPCFTALKAGYGYGRGHVIHYCVKRPVFPHLDKFINVSKIGWS